MNIESGTEPETVTIDGEVFKIVDIKLVDGGVERSLEELRPETQRRIRNGIKRHFAEVENANSDKR